MAIKIKKLPNIDLVSENIIIFGLKQAEGITFDGTFVLKQQLTVIDENNNEVSNEQWVDLVGEDITYKDETLQMLSIDDPELERSIKAILTNSATNDKIMKEAVYNPDQGIYARLRSLEAWKSTSSKVMWIMLSSIVGLVYYLI